MEIIQKKSGKNKGKRVLSCFVFLFIFSLSTIHQAIAQTADSAAQTTTTAKDEGPSLKNISKNMAAGNEEIKKMQEQQHHDEIMSYVYMGLGFSAVIFIAWFTTVLARKRKRKEDEVKAIRAHKMKHDHGHHGKGAHARR